MIVDMSKLKAFHQRGVAQKVFSIALAKRLDETTLHELHRSFTGFDKNGDGRISFDEFKQISSELTGSDGEDQNVKDIFESVDLDGSHYLDYTEFLAACVDQRIESQEAACWAAFRVFDTDGNGLISFDELSDVIKNAAMVDEFTQSTMEQLSKELTEKCQRDKSVDFDEFLTVLRGVRAAPPAKRAVVAEVAASTSGYTTSVGNAVSGLPIANRSQGLPISAKNQGAAASIGLPISGRGGLPIAGRAGVPGLPVANRSSAGGLPIGSRH